jgi:hypothetical protein
MAAAGTLKKPGKISVVFAITSKSAFSHGVPETNRAGSFPQKYCMSAGSVW